METKHTKGPWISHPMLSASENDKGFRIYSVRGEHGIAEVYPLTLETASPEAHANARLIASAPELYEALKRLVGLLEMVAASDAPGPSYMEKLDVALVANMELGPTRAALNLADGVPSSREGGDRG